MSLPDVPLSPEAYQWLARITWMMAACNLLPRWGLEIDDETMVRLSIAEFSL